MIIAAASIKRRPQWYRRHVMRMVTRLVAGNPGFHRLLVVIPTQAGLQGIEGEALVNPDIEPQLRTLLARILDLEPQAIDDDPWGKA